MNERHLSKIAGELNIRVQQIRAAAELLADGATVPFIARYRKEATGTLDEVAITAVRDRLEQLAELDARREAILKSLEERNLLTDELKARLDDAETMTALEDIYMPFRPKRHTRAAIAREKGLEPLADILFAQQPVFSQRRSYVIRRSSLCSRILVCSILLLAGAAGTFAADAPPTETKQQHDARMAWWREARFGMFIHWGLYAIPAGQWKGKTFPPGGGEWIMNTANVPVEEYEQLTKQFNPTKYDPAAWVRLAKAAGVKYIVITSKHHDGFCLFDTKATDYNVVKATPYGKDLLKPLAEECRKQGIHFCTYYSIMDWHHPAQYRGSEKGYNPTRIHPERKAEYIAFMKQQLKELIDSVNPDVLWFDGEWLNWWKEEDAVDLSDYLHKLKPQIIINNRLGTGREGMKGLNKGDRQYVGDFGTPEQEIPANGLPGIDWETCMTMNDTWGYRTDDKNWKSTERLVRQLIDTASKGGNYLLNVGPTAEGEIPRASVERLKGMGKWMAVNGGAIYGTTASPFKKLDWGRCTQKPGKLYLHVFNWPKGELTVPGLKSKVEKAYLLADRDQKPLEVSSNDNGLAIKVPEQAPDPIATVVVLTIKDSAAIAPWTQRQ